MRLTVIQRIWERKNHLVFDRRHVEALSHIFRDCSLLKLSFIFVDIVASSSSTVRTHLRLPVLLTSWTQLRIQRARVWARVWMWFQILVYVGLPIDIFVWYRVIYTLSSFLWLTGILHCNGLLVTSGWDQRLKGNFTLICHEWASLVLKLGMPFLYIVSVIVASALCS